MTKTITKTLNLIKKLSVLPILLGLMFTFCLETAAQNKKTTHKTKVKSVTNKKNIIKIPKKDVFTYSKQDTIRAIQSLEVVNTENYNATNDSVIYNSDFLLLSEKPEFTGGKEAFYKFVGDNYEVPDIAGLKGTIYIQFVVEINGTLTDIKCLRDIGSGSGKEAVRVLLLSPKWKPGILDGKPVRCALQLPISISSL